MVPLLLLALLAAPALADTETTNPENANESVNKGKVVLDLTKATPPTRNFTMLREMKQRLKDLEGKRGDVSAQINDSDIKALTADIEALEKELVAEAEEDSPDEDEDVPP